MVDFHIALLRLVKWGDASDLTPRQLCVLIGVQDAKKTVRDLADELDVSKPVISRAADRLAAFGFADRTDDPKDRRSVLIGVTDKGKQFLGSLLAPA